MNVSEMMKVHELLIVILFRELASVGGPPLSSVSQALRAAADNKEDWSASASDYMRMFAASMDEVSTPQPKGLKLIRGGLDDT